MDHQHHLAPTHSIARKRPRHEELDATALPPLHAYNRLSHASYEPSHRPSAMLPTLSQVLRPSMQLSVLAPPPSTSSTTTTTSQYTPPSHHRQQQQRSPPPQQPYPYALPLPGTRSATSSPSPALSEASMDDDDESEDKTPWPTANEYYDLLANEARRAHIPVYDLGVDPRGVPLQPEFIYNEPKSCMYFLKCGQLLGRGSFGFPRKKKTTVTTKNAKGATESVRRGDATKEFEWRKMSFVTGLPKKQPLVRYITATCYSKTHRSATEKKKVMRMHAVMLASADGAGEQGDYVLVHIRAGGSKRVGVRTNSVAPTQPSKQQPKQQQQQTTPVASPARSEMASSSSSSSIHSLLSAHDQVMMMAAASGGSERPVTPLVFTTANFNSASPVMIKRRCTELLPSIVGSSNCPPRHMPLWLSPPSAQEYHHE